MSNSTLVSLVRLSPNCKPRKNKIVGISIHCTVGEMSIESLGNWFSQSSTAASSNYGIGKDGRIGMYVPENHRSICTSSANVDNRVVTIEVASKNFAPYAVSDSAYKSLIELCVDICKRNGIKELLWSGDRTLLGNYDKQNMVPHRWLANKGCPGEYLFSRYGDIANKVNQILNNRRDVLKDMTQQEFEAILNCKIAELAPKTCKTINDVPGYAVPSIRKAIERGVIGGTGATDSTGNAVLNLSDDLVRTMVILDRLGVLDDNVAPKADPKLTKAAMAAGIATAAAAIGSKV